MNIKETLDNLIALQKNYDIKNKEYLSIILDHFYCKSIDCIKGKYKYSKKTKSHSDFDFGIYFGDDKCEFSISFRLIPDFNQIRLDFSISDFVKKTERYPSCFIFETDYKNVEGLVNVVVAIVKLVSEIYNNGDSITCMSPSNFNVYSSKYDKEFSLYEVIGEDDYCDIYNNDEFDNGFIDDYNNFVFDYTDGFDVFLEVILEKYKNGYFIKKLKEE